MMARADFPSEGIAQDLASSTSSIDLFEKLVHYTGQLGFEYCCYGFRASHLKPGENVKVFDTYPRGWMAHYQRKGYLHLDPTVSAGLKSPLPILWPSFRDSRDSIFWQDARAHGLAHGIAQASWSPGAVFGLLSLARSRDRIRASEYKDLSLKVNWLANLAHFIMTAHILKDMGIENEIKLTAREREVLIWTMEGLNAADISRKLNIATSTVNYHVSQILTKLGSSNKVQAAARAIVMGLI
jgi:LuxR family transcriptional regulator, quorum-sensing system regulator SolR